MEVCKIRPIAICICCKEDQILVFEGYDTVKQEYFYRPLGGGIEFGEYGIDAVKREFEEEIQSPLKNVQYLFTLENIFTCDGRQGHEIVMVYDGQLSDASLYGNELIGHEDDENHTPFRAFWKSWIQIQEEKRPLYPDGLVEQLLQHGIF